jgi:hypothetical protein
MWETHDLSQRCSNIRSEPEGNLGNKYSDSDIEIKENIF